MPGNRRSRASYSRHSSRSQSPRRSPSPRSSRTRRRSYDYSDSFYSDDSRSRSPPRRKENKGKPNGTGGNKRSHFQAVYTKPRGGGRGRGGRRGASTRTASTAAGSPRRPGEETTRRVLSARQNKINDLKNQVDDLNRQLAEAQAENKTLRRDQHLRDRALKKYESEENNVTKMVNAHNAEVRNLREQLRKARDKTTTTDKHLMDAEDELERTKRQLNRLKTLAEEKNLGERDELARKLRTAEADLEDTNRKHAKLEAHLANVQKNHKHEMGIERHRHKDTQKKLQEMTDKCDKLQETLREREKQLEVQNIYAARMAATKHISASNTSLNHTPTPAPRQRKNSEPSMTPRDKAKLFEQKRRTEEKKLRELDEYEEEYLYEEREKKEAAVRQRIIEEEHQKKEEEEARERERRKQEEEERAEKDRLARMEREKQQRVQAEQRRKVDEEERERKRQQEEDRKVLEELEKRKREAESMFKRQKEEQDEREERAERERRAKEERERQEAERQARVRQDEAERERRVREEKLRLEEDEEEREKRRQKDALLAKLKAIDDTSAQTSKETDMFSLPRDRTVTKSKKEYHFTDPIENLHHGKPARDNVTVPVVENQKRRRGGGLLDDDAGYNPSFGTPTSNTNSSRKPLSLFDKTPTHSASKTRARKDSLEDIFGEKHNGSGYVPTVVKKPEELNLHFQTAPTSKVSHTSTTTTSVFSNRTDIFGDSSMATSNSGLLPRRTKQPMTMINNRPTINAIDDIDDDIEEVIL